MLRATARAEPAGGEGVEGLAAGAAPEIADGGSLAGPVALRQFLLDNRRELVRTIVEKLFTFAIGRGPEYYDAPTIRQIVRDIEKSDYQWSSLVLALVKSTPFQMRRVGETPLVAAATAPRRADQ